MILQKTLHPALILSLFCLLSGSALAASGKPKDNNPLPSGPLKVVSLHHATICGDLVQSRWLEDQKAYESVYSAMFAGQILKNWPQPVAIDFDKFAALLVSMGQQRTGGFSVTLASENMLIENGRAVIKVIWKSVKPGMIAIQMLSNPCLLLQLPKGDYRQVEIVDQSGKRRQMIDVSK